MPSTSLTLDRFVLAAAVVLTCVSFTPSTADPVNVVKLTALLLCALALVGSGVYRTARYRVAQVPTGLPLAVTAGLALGLLVSTVVAPVTTTAVLGTYGRNSGLLAYLSALVLFVVALRVLGPPETRVLVGGVVLAGLFTATYGLLQKAGIDAVPWNNPFNPIIAALGNPNFASGYLGITASVGAGAALWKGWGVPWRVLSGITAVTCLLTAALSASVQGPIAAAAGLFVVAVAFSLDLTSRARNQVLAGLAAVAVVGLAALLTGALAAAGPAAAIFSDAGSRARVYYWQAALEMFGDRPLTGVGLDQYGNFWRTARSTQSVGFLGGDSFSDAAHSVPLQVLAQGGLLLGLVYLAFLALTASALVRGLLRLQGADRMLLGAVGGGWAAYQVQSFVSIDQVPLIVLHFTLAGAVLAASGTVALRTVRLPGAVEERKVHPNDARARRRAAVITQPARTPTGTDVAVLGVTAAVLLVGAWFALTPLRANKAVHAGDTLLASGNGNAALEAYEQATGLIPGQSVSWTKTGSLYDQVQQPARALEAYTEASARDPYDVNALRAAAAAEEAVGELDRARRLFDRVARLDPLNADALVDVAQFELRHGGAARAKELLEAKVRALPQETDLWATLGDARAVLSDPVGARQAYERALQLDSTQEVAKAGLGKLAAGS